MMRNRISFGEKFAIRSESGFTTSELLIVVVIIGLIAAIVVPSFGTMIKAYRVRAASDQLVGHLRAARQIAVTQRLPVTFTINPSPDNDYSFSYTIPGKPTTTETFTLSDVVTVTTTPAGALTYTLRQNGTVTNATTPDDQNPTANYVEVSAPINGTTTDTYTISILATGKVSVDFTR